MITSKWGMPGPGGSLGKCAVCGDAFMTEILMGDSVESFSVKGIRETLFAHDKCIVKLKSINGDWQKLPNGPLRKAFEEANSEAKP